MTKNTQPVQRPVGPSDTIQVHSIFHTIQGEGPFCGHAAVFIRLAGCNLQCPLCDTEYTEGAEAMHIAAILRRVNDLCMYNRTRLVVVTGGEPFRQRIEDLLQELILSGYNVQVETNGTLPHDIPEHFLSRKPMLHPVERDVEFVVCPKRGFVHIVVSPKTGFVHPSIQADACAFKYVGGVDDITDDGLPQRALGLVTKRGLYRNTDRYIPTYLQPRDDHNEDANAANLMAVRKSCEQFGFILQLQIHKIIGVE